MCITRLTRTIAGHLSRTHIGRQSASGVLRLLRRVELSRLHLSARRVGERSHFQRQIPVVLLAASDAMATINRFGTNQTGRLTFEIKATARRTIQHRQSPRLQTRVCQPPLGGPSPPLGVRHFMQLGHCLRVPVGQRAQLGLASTQMTVQLPPDQRTCMDRRPAQILNPGVRAAGARHFGNHAAPDYGPGQWVIHGVSRMLTFFAPTVEFGWSRSTCWNHQWGLPRRTPAGDFLGITRSHRSAI